MASSPTDLPVHRFASFDGIELAWRETGQGRPLLLIHGYCSDAWTNWIRYGHAAVIAARGFRVVMPDLRAHGASDKPHDPRFYPPDVLADDAFTLIARLGIEDDYDLAGYSLGGRTVARMLAREARPRRAVIGGMGLEGLTDTGVRAAHFRAVFAGLGAHERGSAEWMAEAFLKTTGGDPVALELILDTFVDTPQPAIARIDLPVLALSGVDDDDNGSAAALAQLLPDGALKTVPGNHMSAVIQPELGRAIGDFLSA